jgi:uncharacterized Zn finger protein (UPF0148 family)
MQETVLTCQKCGFQTSRSGVEVCPRCGAVYAKMQRAIAEKKAASKRVAAERILSARIAKKMEEDESLRNVLNLDLDPEIARDEQAYPVARFLSGLFAFLAAFTALVEALALAHFYTWATLVFNATDLLLFMTALSVFSVTTVVILLAISEGLKIGRDVASNSRAMREYLRRIAGR